jgi:hypothetical protein
LGSSSCNRPRCGFNGRCRRCRVARRGQRQPERNFLLIIIYKEIYNFDLSTFST